jgi:hypothetical protein
MVSAKFLQHGREIFFSFSCVCMVHDDGIEINYLIENSVLCSATFCRRVGVKSGNAGEGMHLISDSTQRHS